MSRTIHVKGFSTSQNGPLTQQFTKKKLQWYSGLSQISRLCMLLDNPSHLRDCALKNDKNLFSDFENFYFNMVTPQAAKYRIFPYRCGIRSQPKETPIITSFLDGVFESPLLYPLRSLSETLRLPLDTSITDIALFGGYVGRAHLYDTNTRHTFYGFQGWPNTGEGGVQFPSAHIIMDYSFIAKMDHAAFQFELTHELLHAFGLDEESVISRNAIVHHCYPTLLRDVTQELFRRFVIAFESFKSRSKTLFSENKTLYQEVCDFSDRIYSLGFHKNNQKYEQTIVYHPTTILPISILFG